MDNQVHGALLTIAKIYAKAAFDFACFNKQIAYWQSMLEFASCFSRDVQIVKLSQYIHSKDLFDIFVDVSRHYIDECGRNFIKILIENSRLMILPFILKCFISLRYDHECTILVKVTTAFVLNKKQISQITSFIRDQLSHEIKLISIVNPSIIGGIIIDIGNTTIDGSILGCVNTLSSQLRY